MLKSMILIGCAVLVGCSSGARTVGDDCHSIAQTTCERYRACDPTAPTMKACTAFLVSECCEAGGTCAKAPAATQTVVDNCNLEIAVQSCESIKDQDAPASCNAVGRAAVDNGGGDTVIRNGGDVDAGRSPAEAEGYLDLRWSVYTHSYGPATCATFSATSVEVSVEGAGGGETVALRRFDCTQGVGLIAVKPGFYTVRAIMLNRLDETVGSSTSTNQRITSTLSTAVRFDILGN